MLSNELELPPPCILWTVVIFLPVSALFIYVLRSRYNRKLAHTLPKLQKQDFTIEELRNFNDTSPDGRLLMAVNGKVFDVTNNGQQYYAKNAPYESFAGKDISRALACFKAEVNEPIGGYDDLSDLSQAQMGRLLEWELQFLERYDHVGRLLRPGEPHHVYDLTKHHHSESSAEAKKIS